MSKYLEKKARAFAAALRQLANWIDREEPLAKVNWQDLIMSCEMPEMDRRTLMDVFDLPRTRN